MSKYILVGGPFEIIDTPHKVAIWGQAVEIPDDLAHGAIRDGAELLPAEKFADHKFTADELQYTNGNLQTEAPPEFHKKLALALAASRAYRAELAAAPAPAEVK